jgi:hypothetical protein
LFIFLGFPTFLSSLMPVMRPAHLTLLISFAFFKFETSS